MPRFNRRHAAFPLLLLLGAASAPAPAVTYGQIFTTTLDVTKPPAAPMVQLHLQGNPTFVSFTWTGPSGQVFGQIFRDAPASSVETFRGVDPLDPESTAPKNVFGLYTEPGIWTLSGLYVCSVAGCVTYTSSQVAALFPVPTFRITNPNPPDVKAPVLQGAQITTPSVSISGGGQLSIEVGVSDDLSGVSQVQVSASPPQSFSVIQAFASVDSTVLRGGRLALTGTVQTSTATGTYTVQRVYLEDVAGNKTNVTDPAEITKLFGGNPSFTVTN